jgi:hypothetical protein
MSRSAPSALALVLACAATLAACGGSSSSAGSAAPTTAGTAAGGNNSAAFTKFRDCLKAQGVDLPPGRGAGGGNGTPPTGTNGQPPAGARPQQSPEQQKAMQACAKYRPQGAGPGGGAGQQNAAAFTPYLNCLKAQGLNVDVKAGFNALRTIKRDDPKLQPALKACASKLPQRPQRAPGASSTTPGGTT